MANDDAINATIDQLRAAHGDQAHAFLVLYSRFEFALKNAGFLERKKEGVNAKADWRHFASHLPPDFFPAARQIAPDYVSDPPRKEVVGPDGAPVFEADGVTACCADSLLILVGRVRNNLFHGGKNPRAAKPAERDRDRALIAQATEVLKLALSMHAGVKEKFCEPMGKPQL